MGGRQDGREVIVMASSPTRGRVKTTTGYFRKCESLKVGYPTYAEALDAAERSMARGAVKPGCHLTPYECDRCDEWHIANRVIVPIPRGLRES
jgi:hypothetical protein